MHYSYVARQPILNAKQHTLGYELLFRDGEKNAFPAHIESNRATYRLIVENFLAVGINPNIPKSRCFINFPYKSLIRRLPLTLPREQIVVEVLETCEPTDELLEAIKELYRRGYLVALDDFVYAPEWERFLSYVHIVKLDIMALGLDHACEFVRQRLAEGSKRRYLAERVETDHQFTVTRNAGFSFFQGYFFSKPEMIKQRYVGPEQIIALELFREVCKPNADFERIEYIVAQDVALSYKLLRFVNTMSDRLSVPISSFRQALVYLGQDKLKTFVSLAVASFVSAKKPKELYNLSLQRAQFCQLMSGHPSFRQHREQAFLIGLFSVLDALLDISIEELVAQLPLCDVVKLALQKREGPIGELLALEECFEQADWQGVESHCDLLGLELNQVSDELSAAQRWSQDIHRLL
ncbi:HDOD domain-containing protein [Vibrio anguillarum]|uniref:HDOD domain-containing protein n=2 Tax=Vibrio TaxID=662 RepID=A0A191W0M9_VIBAN|nr:MULTISPECIES: EAL and HDOD domain-containing protein [Vibrio]OXX73037.1 histidine kinase [Vibrio sp. V03_P4A6T147]AEH31720.1 Diguanylate cyclase/phosphodiesterase domain 2 (EAL) [Vibrio anguillarum 775]AGU56415.1 histidine kinase [Vibrio anguillarum M3]AQM18305.1 histidine kinase [Vibrio anguillarum]AQP34864.1 histidine kinase [Vibrio anguillarum]